MVRLSTSPCLINTLDQSSTLQANSEGNITASNEAKFDNSQGSLDQINRSSELLASPNGRTSINSIGRSSGVSKFQSSTMSKSKSGFLEGLKSLQTQPKEVPKTIKSNLSPPAELNRESVLKSGKYSQWLECEKKRDDNDSKAQIAFFCRWCRNYNQDNNLAKGVSMSDNTTTQGGFNTKVFKEHKDTPQHREAKESFFKDVYSNRDLTVSSPTNTNGNYTKKLRCTIGLVLDLLKQNLTPESCLEILRNAVSRGLELSASDVNYTSLKELIKTMSDCIREKTIEEINSSPYFSLILCPWPPGNPGSSHIRAFEIVCYYIKQGVPKHAYFDTIVLKDTEYCGLIAYKRLVSFLKKSNIEYQQKLVGLFTNGDLLFNSKNTGLSDLLKKEVTDLTAIHPLSYRYFTLSTQNYGLTKAFPFVENVFQLCIETFAYFNTNQKLQKELFENKAEIEELLVETSGSRNPGSKWSILLNGISRIVRSIGKVYKALKEATDFQGKGLEMYYRNPNYVAWMHFLTDFGPFMTNIGAVFREKSLSLKGKVKAVMACKKKITEKFLIGEQGINFKEGLWGLFTQGYKENAGKACLFDEVEFDSTLDIDKVGKDFKKFVETFMEEIDRRYSSVYDLESLALFDLAYLKEKAGSSAHWQGVIDKAKESVGKFLKVLGKEQFIDQLLQELPNLLQYLKENCMTDSKATILNELFYFCQEKFPVCIDLVSRYYVLPISLGEVEKSLRLIGKAQTKIKGSMSDELVRATLMLNVSVPDGEAATGMIAKFAEEWKQKVFSS